MKVIVERERYNPLLRRREIHARISYWGEGYPRRSEVREKFAGLFNSELDRVVVQFIKPEFGKQEARCYVKIYDTPKDLRDVEEEHIIKRNFGEVT